MRYSILILVSFAVVGCSHREYMNLNPHSRNLDLDLAQCTYKAEKTVPQNNTAYKYCNKQ